MDAYYSLSMGAIDADLEAAELFPALEPPTSLKEDKSATHLLGLTAVQPISNGSGSERITMRYVTFIPLADLQGKTPQQVVQMSGGARVEGVTFVKPQKQ